ncbi:hypothetical protein L6J37_00035 [Photobacterium sp. WH77]|uniref:DUF2946 domain-containing protein n=1 Tax=Photobacterium arenosum TaxID=2774143 RepID=A0ABR9BK86_9GAMM|nr:MULTISPECIES: hypothetical protein [Photobacterium]MBD8512599.1 hypothetical protein [Photobacterium arenosum]MBV7261319.1 hypothetical protein [Photobacterium sp. WH24]MCG2835251.1 hypothetical protein [Photobacterium sp. WH77]MCG2842864.1 hypothetical protein [Photobacterium sp. WH80]MDO6583024.1 hypothetical protein [Photobacterium sp. 2_MG-2023]
MHIRVDKAWHKGILALVFGLFILASPIQILHDFNALNPAVHSEHPCPYCHAFPAGLPTATPSLLPDSAIPIQHSIISLWHADWLSPFPTARDPPVNVQ